MRSGPPHDNVARAIKSELEKHEIIGLRTDDRQYHEDLFPNIQTYMHGCGLGVAVFEQVEQKVFDPNVALEVGYMLALNKRICLLKEKNSWHSILILRANSIVSSMPTIPR